MNENFTFIVLAYAGHSVEQLICNRAEADKRFDALCGTKGIEGVYYYSVANGGLVNSYHAF